MVTTCCNGKFNGQIANTVFQVTAEPIRIAVSLAKENLTCELISKSGTFAVSVLDEETPMKFIGLFGFKSGRDVDKLSQVEYKLGVTGCPLVTENAVSVLEAEVIDQVDAGTHIIFVADVVSADVLGTGKPMTYAFYQEVKKGRASRLAPTYKPHPEEDKREGRERGMKKYVCDVCGYVYDPAEGDADGGIPAGTPFEDLPGDWVCPICGAGKEQFSPPRHRRG